MNLGRTLKRFQETDATGGSVLSDECSIAEKGLLRESMILSIPPWLAYAIALLAFYPAVMTVDSLDQWSQIDRRAFTDWHPPLHTLLMDLLRRAWDSPAMIASCQALAMGGAIGTLIAVVRRATGAGLQVAFIGSLLVAVFPLTFIMTVTLWKDVFYSVAVLMLTTGAIAAVCLGRRPVSSSLTFAVGLVVAVACMTFRHNGPPVALVLVGLVVVFVPAQRKVAIGFLLTACIIAAVCQGPAMNALGVRRTHPSVALLAHHIAAHLHAGTQPVGESERQLLSSIKPDGWNYNCALVNYTIFVDGFDLDAAKRHRRELFSIWWEMAKAHPGTELRHLFCVSGLVWNPVQSGSGYLYTVGIVPDDAHDRWIDKNDLGLHEASPLGRAGSVLRNAAFGFIDETWLVRPAGYLYTLMVACAAAMLASRHSHNAGKAALCVFVAALVQSVPLLIANVAQDARYQLPVYVMSLGLAPIFIWTAWRSRGQLRVELGDA